MELGCQKVVVRVYLVRSERVREAIATGIIVYQHIRPKHNKADCLTKMLGGTAFHQMVKGILFRTPHRG